ncbi:polyprenyl synthetase family protein [Pseudactinotalea suaedae]|uniref:polyprenyl synthetase family protein n=1 Tax=Pseudactinotalea suaedae TaxID=1524924 RepID=UPI0012E17461|nr:polyprenyl synthetase family protein [Pseudactinotalea suaedae]
MTSPLPLGDDRLEEEILGELESIERRLIEAAANANPLVQTPTRHLMEAGGKRLRPVLVLLTSHFGSGINEEVRTAAVATELTHLATLYHDDVMDDAPLRRGAPSAQQLWGNSVAILTGDLLFAKASQMVSALGPVAVRIQADAFERLVLGQLHETLGPGEGEDAVAHYIGVLSDKTGSLIAAAAKYGTLFSGADELSGRASIAYGEKVGVAFQLADDVIDLISDAETLGKEPGTDLRAGVATMPVLLLRARAAAGDVDEVGAGILRDLDSDDEDVRASTLERLRRHEVLEETRVLARQWATDAVTELETLPDSAARRALIAFADIVVDRLA